MFDILACILLLGIMVVLFEIGKTISYHSHLIQKFMMARTYSLKTMIEYITLKLKQFLRFLRRMFSSKKDGKSAMISQELLSLTHQLEIIELEA